MADRPAGPLPAPPLTIRPVGLLDFLSIQAGGRYPQHLLEDLQPTMDLMRWFHDAQAEVVNNNTAGLLSGPGSAGVGFTVPAGEAWLVSNFNVSVTVPALMTRFIMGIYADISNGSAVRRVIAYNPIIYLAGDAALWGHTPDVPLLFMPGTIIGPYSVCAVGAATAQAAMSLSIVRCTV